MAKRCVECLDASIEQVRTGQVGSGRVKSGQVKLGQVKSRQFKSSQVMLSLNRAIEDRSTKLLSGQVK